MSIRKRGNSYQVIYRCPGEASPRTETFKTEEEALIRDMQIKLAKKNGTFEPMVKIAKGAVRAKNEITVSDFLDEYVEVYGLKKWGNSYYSMSTGLIQNYIKPYLGERYVRSLTVRDMKAMGLKKEEAAVLVSKSSHSKISTALSQVLWLVIIFLDHFSLMVSSSISEFML